MKKDISALFYVNNIILTFLVVAIHCFALKFPNGYRGDIMIDIIVNGFFRCAVPGFAFVSGYFLIDTFKKLQIRDFYLSKFFSFCIPFILASLISAILFYTNAFVKNESFLASDVIISIFFHPKTVQLWYLRDLILITLIFPIFFKLISSKASYIFMPALFICWLLEYQFFPIFFGYYLINVEVLFFLLLGAYVSVKRFSFMISATSINKFFICILFIAISFISYYRVMHYPNFSTWYNNVHNIGLILSYKITILLSLFLCFSLSSQLSVYFSRSKSVSGLMFFVFLMHLSPTAVILNLIFPNINSYAFVFIVFFFTILLGYLVKLFIPKLYLVLIGSR
jgi:hypothetical protein